MTIDEKLKDLSEEKRKEGTMMSPLEHLEESINYALETIELGKNKTIEPPIKEKKYIIRYGHTKFYIGEEREIMMIGA